MTQPRTRDERILATLATGLSSTATLADATALPERTVQAGLRHLRTEGLVSSPARGTYRLTGRGRAEIDDGSSPATPAPVGSRRRPPAEHDRLPAPLKSGAPEAEPGGRANGSIAVRASPSPSPSEPLVVGDEGRPDGGWLWRFVNGNPNDEPAARGSMSLERVPPVASAMTAGRRWWRRILEGDEDA